MVLKKTKDQTKDVKKKETKQVLSDSKLPKIRIKLKSYDLKMLESSLSKVVWILRASGADIVGPIPLPKKKKIYTVIRSNFVYKNSREQFERLTYSRLIDITQTWPKTIEELQNLSISVWVLVDIKVF